MLTGQKHLVKCRCVLPQYKKRADPLPHQFIVFSIIDDDNRVKPKHVQCNNCGIIHKVIDVGRTEIVSGREFMSSIMVIDEIKSAIPEKLAALLESNNCDLPTWENVKFIIESKRWGDYIILNSDEEDGLRQGKYVTIMGENLFKVDSFTREEVVRA